MDMITIDPIEMDNIVDTAEESDGIQITGTSTAIVGSLVTVVVDGVDYTTTVTAMGTWAIAIPAGTLPDALFSVTADVTDAVQASTSFDLAANNAPVTGAANLAGAVTEIADGAPGENIDTLEATGDIDFTDADLGDVHSVGTAPVGGGVGFIGLFFAGLSDPATGDGAGTVTWTFQVNDALLDSLNDGEVVTQDYDITIDDGFGGIITETVAITITGTADAAVVTGDTSGASTEDSGVTTTGNLDHTDADNADADDAWNTAVTVNGLYGTLTITAAGVWEYTLDDANPAVDALAVGEPLVDTITVETTDGTTQDITINITGANDAPTVSAAIDSTLTEDDAPRTLLLLSGAADVDTSDVLSVANLVLTGGDDSGITVNPDTLDIDPSAYNYLAVGESAVITYSYDVIDGNGGSVAQTASITITGENDGPIVTAAATGGGTEDDAAFSVNMLDGVSDPDLLDILNVDGMSVTLVSGDDSGVTVNGNALDVDPSAYNYLAVGESAVIVYSYDVLDGNGGSVAQMATITITGENDAPTVAAALTDGSTEDDMAFTVDMLAGASDVDLTDTLNVDGPSIMTVSGDDSGINVLGNSLDVDPNAYNYLAVGESAVIVIGYNIVDGNGGSVAQTATITITGENDAPTVSGAVTDGGTEDDALFSVDLLDGASDPDLSDILNVDGMSLMLVSGDASGITVNGNALDVDPNAYTHLAVGESEVITYSYDIVDGNGGSVPQTATITITGENDAPTVAAAVTGGSTEDDVAFSVDMLAGASDVDLTDALNVDGMSVMLVSGDDSGITVNGNALDVDPSAYNYLAVGESAVIVYSYDIIDGNGGSVAQTATITITGENDAPTIGAALTPTMTEDDAVFNVSLLAGASDPDTSDVLNVTNLVLTGGDDSGVTVNGNFLDIDPNAYTSLAVGESEVITYSYDIIDGNGGSVAQTATITITGENDAPTVAAAVTGGSTEDDMAFSVDMLAGASDVDLTDTLNVDGMSITLVSGDDGGVTINGNALDVDPSAYNYLAVGESAVIVYSYNIVDGNGGSVAQTATITITGENDAPTVAAAVTGGGNEDDALFSVDMLAGASDPDTSDVLNVDGASIMLTGGDPTGVTINGNALDIDPNAYNYLDDGESEIITYSYNIIDGNGGSVAQTATITITGTNDAPEIDLVSGLTGAVTEIADGAPGENVDVTQFSNTITFVDPEINDAHTAVITPTGPNVANYIGIMGGALTDTATGDGVGEISWVFSINDSELDYLAEGEVIIQTYEVSVQDDGAVPLSDTETITITITGTNDAPIITSGAQGAAIVETAMTTGDATTHDESGTITFDDVDISDVDHALTTSLATTGVTGGLPDAMTLDSFMTLSGLAVGMGSGTFDWDFSAADSVFDYLADGEVVTLTYTVTIDDGDGGTIDQDIIITVTGTNDAPTTTIDMGDADIAFLNEADNGLTAAATISVQDVDISDVVTVSVDSVGESGDVSGIANGTLLAMLGVDMGAIIDGVSTDGTINWSFDSGMEAFDYLADGEALTLTYTLLVEDDAMGVVPQSVTIVIQGTNDQPVITLGDDTSAVTEDASMPNLTDTGSFTFSDADDSDILVASVAQEGAATTTSPSGISMALNAALTSAMGIVQTGINDGTIDWTFTLDNALTQYLGAGETVTVVYRVSIDDGSGAANAVQAQDITVTITGTNDIPVATGDVLAINEDDLLMGDVSTNDTDADGSAVLTYTLTAPIDGLTLNPDGSYTFDADHATYAHLADGATEVVNAAYIVTDDQGATDTETLVITITGVNDAPNLAAPLTGTANEDDTSFLIDLLSGASDVDDGDSVSIANVTGLTAGVTLMGTLLTVDPTDASFQSLAVGEELIIVVSYDVEDLNGGVSPQTATITITGTNDDPVALAVVGAADEDGPAITVMADFTDIDTTDTHTFTVDTTGTLGSVTNNMDGSFDYDANGAFESLAVGEMTTDTFTYTVDDGNGGTSTETVTITITGQNDAPVALAIVGAADEDGPAITVSADFTDVDTTDTHTFTVDTTGTVGAVTNNMDGTFDYDASGAFDSLAPGETVTDTFTYTVDDGNGGTSTETVTITITGANDAPTITGLTNDTVSEFAANGTIVGEAITDDVDGGGPITFAMVDDAGGRFAIDGITGEITVVDGLALDFEQSALHSIMVEVTDGLDVRTETIQINISDVGPEIVTADDVGRTLVGGATNDIFTGGLGDDIFDGGAGNDRLDGGSGTNMLAGGDGSDTFIGGDGVDAIDGGTGFDTVDYRGAGSSVEFDLGTGGTLGDAAGDTYTGLERAYGSDFDDVITGTAGNEFLHGEGGNDTINAGDGIDRVYGGDGNDIQRGDGGNDTLYGSAGNDQLNGGTGFDIANYSLAAAAVIVDMAAGGTGGDADGDTYFGIEAVYGSAFDDSITGNSTNNQLRGNGGNDSLFGGAGNDSLFGGAGADALDGGTGIDTAFYTTATAAVIVDLVFGGGGGEANGDTYTSIENVRGSAFADDISGDNNANSLYGNDGADLLSGEGGNDRIEGGDGDDMIFGGDGVDTLFGQAGNDTILGDAGNDFMYGSAGGDVFDGGADFDTVSYIQSASGVTVNMQTGGTGGDAAGDSYLSVERLFGSNSADDIIGSDGADSLFGLGGDDLINGGLGNDRMYGGAGDDTFTYDTTNSGADLIYDFRAGTLGDELIIIEGGDPNFDSFVEVMAVATQVGANVRFNFGSGNFLTLVNLDISRLEAADFQFGVPAEAPPEDKNAADAEMPTTDMDLIASYLGDAPSSDIGGDIDTVDVDASLYSGEVFDLI